MSTKLSIIPTILAAVPMLLIACAADGAVTDLASFGVRCDGTTDDTDALRRAFASLGAGDVLTFPPGAICIISGQINVQDQIGYTVTGNGAVLKVADGTPKDRGPFVALHGGGAAFWADLTVDGNRDARPCPAPYSGDQVSTYHNVLVAGVRDLTFTRVRSLGSCMDGLYVAALDPKAPETFSEGIRLIDFEALHNRRQGVSIINARDVLIEGGSYSFSDGDWPAAGIDLEPNPGSANPAIVDVLIRSVLTEGNTGVGINVADYEESRSIDVVVEDSVIRNNKGGAFRVNGVNLIFRRNLIEDHPFLQDGARSHSEMVSGHDIKIIENTWRHINSYAPLLVVFRIHLDEGIAVTNNCFEDVSWPIIVNYNDDPVEIHDNIYDPGDGCPDPGRSFRSRALKVQ